MSNKGNILFTALSLIKELFGPIVKLSSHWPPILAYGVPSILAALLIVLLRSTLPDNLLRLVLVLVLAPLAGYIFTDWDKRNQATKSEIAQLGVKPMIRGNVFFEDGFPINGAEMFVDGVVGKRKTNEEGWFQIEVDEQDSWTVRAIYMDQATHLTVTKNEVRSPVRLSLKRASRESEANTEFLNLVNRALDSLHVLDNEIRETLGPVSRFEHTWMGEQREEAISKMGELADSQVILPKVRQFIAELETKRGSSTIGPEEANAADIVLACGRKTLESFGGSEITPWPGYQELQALISGVRTADRPEAAESVRQEAQKALAVVDRRLLMNADFAVGQLRGMNRNPDAAHH